MNIGYHAEEEAVRIYQNLGFTILEKNYRYFGSTRGQKAEIDIIAKKSNLLACIEVKYRKNNSMVTGEESITHKKLTLMQLALQHFLTQHKELEHCIIRFDAVIFNEKKYTIIENILQ